MAQPYEIKAFLNTLRADFDRLNTRLDAFRKTLPQDTDEQKQAAENYSPAIVGTIVSLLNKLIDQKFHDQADVHTAVQVSAAYLDSTQEVESLVVAINHDKAHKELLAARSAIRTTLLAAPGDDQGSDPCLARFIALLTQTGASSALIERTRLIAIGAPPDDLDDATLTTLQSSWNKVVQLVTDASQMNGAFGKPETLADQLCVHETLDRLYVQLSAFVL